MKMLHQKKKKKSINPPIKKSVINTLTEKNQIINIVLLTNDRSWGKKWLVTERQTELRGRERREGWGELNHFRSDCTHRGGSAIGPCSTPPSFVLTPAAFPPVGLISLSLPLAATSVVVHVWREVALVVSLRSSVGIPFSVAVSISAGIQSSVPFAVSSVKCPQLGRAIVKAPTELQKPPTDKIFQRTARSLHCWCRILNIFRFFYVCMFTLII